MSLMMMMMMMMIFLISLSLARQQVVIEVIPAVSLS
jgi:hypothetical protein